jgi:hypothetical protein
MQTQAHVVHQTKGRMRLRIPRRRKDLPYFLDLYEDLRQVPDITDVVINPSTASVLLYFPEKSARPVLYSLQRIGLLQNDGGEQSSRPLLGRIQGLLTDRQGAATDARTILLTIMIGIAIHQALRGRILAPALSALWYAYDLIAARKREREVLDSGAGTSPEPLGE